VGGEYVVAAAAGTSMTCDFSSTAGYYVVIDHGNGHRTRYLHLQGYAIAYGPSVSRGQLIGFEGDTGDVRPLGTDQLHFETRHGASAFTCGSDGTAVDPYAAGTYMWATNPPSYAEGETIGVSSWASNRIDVFVTGNNFQLYHRWWDQSSGWHPPSSWEGNHGGCLKGGPAAVSRTNDRIDVFGRDCATNQLLKRSWSGSQWLNWVPLGGCLRSAPAVTSSSSTRLDVFYRGCSDQVEWRFSNNSGASWSSPTTVAGCTQTAPGAAVYGGIHLFIRGCDNALYRNYAPGATFQGYIGLGGCLGAGPAADSWGPNRLDVFVRGCSDANHHNWSGDGGNNWSGFIEPDPCITSAPGATSRQSGLLDVFARGCGNRDFFIKWWNGSVWTGWNYLIGWP
jgi:hypothetical protein